MYESFYGLTSAPFQLPPDARFFYGSAGHNRAIAHLSFGLGQGEGFVVITGEVGAGKTTLVERLWSHLDHGAYAIARIVTTQLSGDDLFRLAMAGFGVEVEAGDKAATILRFQAILREHGAAGRRCVLIVDEAQNLSRTALEELRMLSNFSTEGQASVQTVLLGQPEFRRMLASPELDQLRQRVIASFHLGPLDPAECEAYIRHRLTTAGWSGDRPTIEPDAFAATYRATGGVPRRINRLFSRVLLLGALDGVTAVTAAMVTETADELTRDLDGAGALPSAAVFRSDVPTDLTARVSALEQTVARREYVMTRLSELLTLRG